MDTHSQYSQTDVEPITEFMHYLMDTSDAEITELLDNPNYKISDFDFDIFYEFYKAEQCIHKSLRYLFNHTRELELIPFDERMLKIKDKYVLMILLSKSEMSEEDKEIVLSHGL